ncbi:uncharacterized protein AKAME5_000101700 [Lates japonicus]|uniref:Uncharacterized protein n=1 Tax=Lates japonicus TaxID=270547 RepID=A0AAD3QX23_LATJO|nr:uncharacterized protein AKAME5_000101700 [Lates japonicus]
MLLVRITKATRTFLSLGDFSDIIDHLANRMVQEYFGTHTFMTPDEQTFEKIHKTLFKYLCQWFGSAEILQAAMISHDPAFENAVIHALKHHLIFSSPPPFKKGRIHRFFSSVSTTIARPFRACRGAKIFPGTTDQAEGMTGQTPVELFYTVPKKQNAVTTQPETAETSAAMSEGYKAHYNVVSLLVTGLLMHTAKEARTSLLEIDLDRILKHLTVSALAEIDFTDIVISSDSQRFKEIPKAVFKDLRQEFVSANVLLEAMLSQNSAVDDAFVSALKTHLKVFALTRKNKIVRFFSSVARAIAKPFTGLCGCSSDAN